MYVAIALLVVVAILGFVRHNTSQVHAASTANFDASHIIDDVVFYNPSTMSVNDIQGFLNSKVPTCSTNHTGITGSTGTVYNPQFICLKDFYENPSATYSVSFTYRDTGGSTQGSSRTYNYNNAYQYTALCPVYVGGGTTCDSGDYTRGLDHLIATIQPINGVRPGGAISAAQIIYNAAQQYSVSPQALLVLLQKEQGLVTDTWPAAYEYQAATGYGCPDYQPCSTSYAGFSNQVANAAWQFQQYRLHPSSYSYQAGRNNTILWSPAAGCGSSVVNIQNQATASLYNYTPYRPNQAALNAGYGTGDSCSSYGNRNFWEYFTDWFGSTYNTGIPLINSLSTNTLAPNTTMNAGDYITSPNGKFVTFVDYNGNVVTYAGTSVVWSTNTSGNWGAKLTFQTDGNLVLYSATGAALWNTSTNSSGANQVALGDDGNVVVTASGTQKFTTNIGPLGSHKVGTTIASNTTLSAGDYLETTDNINRLIMQADGNLVLYSSNGKALWNSSTDRNPGATAVMQADGNFVIYSVGGNALWNSSTDRNPGATAVMQADGNFVIYSVGGNALWNSSTDLNQYQAGSYLASTAQPSTSILPNTYLRSSNWQYRVYMMPSGNLVLYSVKYGRVLWSSNTAGNPGAYAVMQSDGNFVIYSSGGRALWNSSSAGNPGAYAVMQSDGNFVIYSSGGRALWNSSTGNQF
jgi:hypothetical protein